jgi:adenylate kinase
MCDTHSRRAWIHGLDEVAEPSGNLPAGPPFRLVLLGPPGVGKGTQAQLLCRALGSCHLSTGDVFRAAGEGTQATNAVALALDAMKRGELVSDDLVISTVYERSRCLRCRAGFLLDGFPRTLPQAKWLAERLDQLGMQLDAVVNYELPLETIVARLGGRRTCADCKTVFHEQDRPPARGGICDECGGRLIQRSDDRPEVVRVRMEAYQREAKPLTDFYEKLGLLVNVSASGEPEAILRHTLKAVAVHLPPLTERVLASAP